MMNPEIKERWIAKLTSGEYEQTEGELFDGLGYCCLGVLCEVAVEDGIVEKVSEGDTGYRAPSIKRDGTFYEGEENVTYIENSTLPHAVVLWAGLDSTNPDIPFGDGVNWDLATLNDEKGLKFPEIANYIKDNL